MSGGVTKKGPIPVRLGKRTFESKAAAKQAVRDILHAASPDEIITDPEITELCCAIARISGRWSCEIYLGLRRNSSDDNKWSGAVAVAPDRGNKHPHFQFVMEDGSYRQVGSMGSIDKPEPVSWGPELHRLWPRHFKEAMRTFALCSTRLHVRLPGEIIQIIGATLDKQLELQ